jgi:thiamine-monophosphate kinase
VGDSIYLTTLPGWSAAGLIALEKNISGGAVDFAISEHRSPSVDYDNAEQIAINANSLCDISDSLLIQAEQMADASGVEFEINGELIKTHPDFAELSRAAELLNVSVFDLILSGGEDHVFLATGHALNGFEIGKVNAGSGIRLTHLATPQPGWQHFS